MAFPGTGDIGVQPGGIVKITAPGGTWTIQASDMVHRPQPPAPPPGFGQRLRRLLCHPAPPQPQRPADVSVSYPVDVDTAGGAKISVVGAADVTLPRPR